MNELLDLIAMMMKYNTQFSISQTKGGQFVVQFDTFADHNFYRVERFITTTGNNHIDKRPFVTREDIIKELPVMVRELNKKIREKHN